MEPGNGAAGHGREQDREQEQDTVLRGYGEAREGREQFRVDIRMGAEDADDGDNQHGVQQEGAQVVTGLEQNPDGRDGGDGDVEADNPHPGLRGEVERVEVHADGHDEDDGDDAEDGRGRNGLMAAVYADAEDDGYGDEEQGDHGDGSIRRTGRRVEHTVLEGGTEGGGHDGREGCHDEDQCQIGEDDE